MSVGRHSIEDLRRQASSFRSKHQRVAGPECGVGIGVLGACFDAVHPHSAQLGEAGVEVIMHVHRGQLGVVEPRTSHLAACQLEAEWLHEVQRTPSIRAEADRIARVGRNLGSEQNYVKHADRGAPGSLGP